LGNDLGVFELSAVVCDEKNSLWRLGIPVYVGVVAFFNALIVYFVSYLIVKWAKARALRKQRE
jgi:hypothetical protein